MGPIRINLGEDFHMHSCSAISPILKSDSLDRNFHMHSRVGNPRISEPDTPEEGFHMHSYSAALPICKPASPDKDTQTRSHSRSCSRCDPTHLVDNFYERTHKYSGLTRCSGFLRSRSPESCPYPCEHQPYMAATHNVHYVHLLELTENAENHTNTPEGPDYGDNVDQASIANSDKTTEELWRPSSRQSSMHNAKEESIPWAEWVDLPPSLEDSPCETPLNVLPLVAPYRRSGPLHLNNEPFQTHSASMARQHLKPKSGPRPLDLKEALSLIRSTEARRPAPESTFALFASSKDPFMGHGFPCLDNGFIEFAKSSLSSIPELPDQYGAAPSQHESASSLDVLAQSAQQKVFNRSAVWQVSFPALAALSLSMRPLTSNRRFKTSLTDSNLQKSGRMYCVVGSSFSWCGEGMSPSSSSQILRVL